MTKLFINLDSALDDAANHITTVRPLFVVIQGRLSMRERVRRAKFSAVVADGPHFSICFARR